MKYKLLLIIVTILIFSNISIAQKKYYEKGYVVTLNGDTMNGYLRHLKHNTLLSGIDFKKNMDDSLIYKHFDSTDIQSFYFIKDNLWFKQVVYTSPDKKIVERKFGQLLVSGSLNLFRLDMLDSNNSKIFEEENDHIYIVQRDSEYTVLRMTESIVNDVYKVDKDYKKQIKKLLVLAGKPTDPGENFEKLLFRDSQLKKVFSGTYEEDSTMHKIDTSAIILNSHNRTSIKNVFTIGDVTFLSKGVNTGNGYVFSYLFHLLRPHDLGRFSFVTGIEYAKYNGMVVNNIKKDYVRLPFLAKYSIMKGTSFEPFINLGTAINISTLSRDELNIFTTNFGIGTYYKDRLFFSLMYEYSPLLNMEIENSIFNNLSKYYGIYTRIGVKLF